METQTNHVRYEKTIEHLNKAIEPAILILNLPIDCVD